MCEVLAGIDQWGMATREMFLRQDGEGQHAKWIVDYAILGRAMKRATVESIIRDKIGDKALRCWRIMEAKGKLDEKHVSYSFVFNAIVYLSEKLIVPLCRFLAKVPRLAFL